MVQRLICFSDTHDVLPPVIDRPDVVAVLHAGDFYSGANLEAIRDARPGDQGMAEWITGEQRRVAEWLGHWHTPICAVRGNHDTDDPWGFFHACQDVTGRVVRIAEGLFVAGIGWHGQAASDLPGESELPQICQTLRRQVLRILRLTDRLIVLSHYPPAVAEIADRLKCGPGSACVREFIAETAASACIFGHIHESAGLSGELVVEERRILLACPEADGSILSIPQNGRATIRRAITPR